MTPQRRGAFLWRSAVFALFLALCFGSSPLLAQESRWKPLIEQVEKLYQQGQYAQAIPLAEQCLKLAENATGADQPALVIRSLNDLGALYLQLGASAKAEPLLARALAMSQKNLGPDDPGLILELNNLAEVYVAEGLPAKAEPLLERATALAEKNFGPDDPNIAVCLDNQALLYLETGASSEAEPLLERAVAIAEKVPAPGDSQLPAYLNTLAMLYIQQGDPAKAEPLLTRALALLEKTFGPNNVNVVVTLNELARAYDLEGSFAKAAQFYGRALPIEESALGPDSPVVAETMDGLGEVLIEQADYSQAEPILTRALAIQEKVAGPKSPAFALALKDLATLYATEGAYARAEPLLNRALAIQGKTLGPESPQALTIMDLLASLYMDRGDYVRAQQFYERAFAIQQKILGPDSMALATPLFSMASLFVQEGDYARAETLYKHALALAEKTLGPDNASVGMILSFLSKLYVEEGNYAQAVTTVKQALAIDEKTIGPESPVVALCLNNWALADLNEGAFAKAEPLLERVLAIDEKATPDHPIVAMALNNLAGVYMGEGQYAKAEPLFRRALAIWQKALGPSDSDVAQALTNLAELDDAEGKTAQAQLLLERSIGDIRGILNHQFDYMSEKGRLQFLDTVSWTFPTYFSFVQRHGKRHPELYGRMYDVVLWQKGLVAQGIASLQRQIAAGGDAQTLALFQRFVATRRQISNLANPDHPGGNLAYIQQLQQTADGLEAQLVQRSRVFARKDKQVQATWQDVRDSLKPGQAAVEYVRYPFNNGKKWTNEIEYAALVVTPKSKEPAFFPLGTSSELAGKNDQNLQGYRAWVSRPAHTGKGQSDATKSGDALGFYDDFWKPFVPALGRAKTIYVAPDGALDQVSLGVVRTPGGKLLMDRYDLRIVNSTRDLLRRPQPSGADTAVLVGNPKFQLSASEQQAALATLHQTSQKQAPDVELAANIGSSTLSRGMEAGAACNMPPGGVFCPLPGTEAEVQAVAALLREHHWTVERPLYVGDKALEEAVLGVQHPRVLYLATHGFFFPDPEVKSNSANGTPPAVTDPMLRSGLVFTGADQAFLGFPPPEGMDDGVLTAYAASTLNLQGTELVVLSACDTGLGQYEAGEGVFGLRRAFEEAGAQAVLMSMWKVPDRETEELMTRFFRYWLGGMHKHSALKKAQQQMRKIVKQRYGRDLPYYWGAWVLVGR